MNLLLLQPSPCWLRSVGSLCFPSVPCVLRYSIRTVIIALIGNQTAKQMTSNFQLFGRYFSLVMAESSLRGRWIPADLLIHYMNQKFNIGSDMLLTTRTLMTYMNKCYPSMSYDPNRITIPSGTVVDFYRANCQVKSVRYNLFFFSDHGSPAPLFPKNSNVASFLNNSVTKRLLGGSRQIRTGEVMDNLEVGSLNKRAKLMNSNEADTPSIEALNQHQSSSTISDTIE